MFSLIVCCESIGHSLDHIGLVHILARTVMCSLRILLMEAQCFGIKTQKCMQRRKGAYRIIQHFLG